MIENKKTFTFVVLAYNHEKYIIEHLESIRFLIENYASEAGVSVSIIINDDCSKDSTPRLVSEWLNDNGSIFFKVTKIFNKTNVGTCKSLLNCLEFVESDSLKITAGDDVYSYENIFHYAFLGDECAILSGFPLSLVGGVVSENKTDTVHILATQIIYQDVPLIKRVGFLSNHNAPNIIYNKKMLMEKKVSNALSEFDVVEDWPIQIMMSINFPKCDFDLVNKVFVYYRRTSGSTYIVATSRFYKDKLKCFDLLISKLDSKLDKFYIANRKFVFELNKKLAGNVINVLLYKYVFAFVFRLPAIIYKYLKIDFNVKSHQDHYNLIKMYSDDYLRNRDFDIS